MSTAEAEVRAVAADEPQADGAYGSQGDHEDQHVTQQRRPRRAARQGQHDQEGQGHREERQGGGPRRHELADDDLLGAQRGGLQKRQGRVGAIAVDGGGRQGRGR